MDLLELRAARIPIVGWFAHHYWFVIASERRADRWEVWQFANQGGVCHAHVHKNLLPPAAGVGWGASWLVASWRGAAAEPLIATIEGSMDSYPWCERYRYWPGPNSNTYVQWILGERYRLPWQAVGRRFARRSIIK